MFYSTLLQLLFLRFYCVRGCWDQTQDCRCFALIVRIFFINPRPAYRNTEKDGEGERDTGIISGKGVTRHVARGYLRTYSLDRWRRCQG
jgi:hypothetical protein